MRLIDADALAEDVKAAKSNSGMGAVVADTILRYVKRCPTIDAVEVVRCKQCLYCKRSADGAYFCDWHRDFFQVFPSDYCSNGERK